jgi:hypothetical protein
VADRRTSDATLIEAVRILSRTITTDDGVIPACLAEVATRLEELVEERRWISVKSAPKGSGFEVLRTDDPNNVEPPNLLLLCPDGQAVGYWDWHYAPGGAGAFKEQPAWRERVSGEAIYGVTHYQSLPPGPEGDA